MTALISHGVLEVRESTNSIPGVFRVHITTLFHFVVKTINNVRDIQVRHPLTLLQLISQLSISDRDLSLAKGLLKLTTLNQSTPPHVKPCMN